MISRYTLRSGNGVKLLIVLIFAIPTLAVFLWFNQVHLGYGLAMALFQAIGAYLAVKFVVHIKNADLWIHRLLITIVAVSAVKFLL